MIVTTCKDGWDKVCVLSQIRGEGGGSAEVLEQRGIFCAGHKVVLRYWTLEIMCLQSYLGDRVSLSQQPHYPISIHGQDVCQGCLSPSSHNLSRMVVTPVRTRDTPRCPPPGQESWGGAGISQSSPVHRGVRREGERGSVIMEWAECLLCWVCLLKVSHIGMR